jgi:hypothetical protein
MSRAAWVLVWAASALAAGCGLAARRPGGAAAPGSGGVVVVNLQAMPTAINWDNNPGSDGLRCRVYLFGPDPHHPESMSAEGDLDFLIYEGAISHDEIATSQAVYEWHFSRAALQAQQVRSIAGMGYAFSLPWGDKVPTSPTITLVARYTAPGAKAAYSSPVAIVMKAT